MFKPEDTARGEFDRIKSASSASIASDSEKAVVNGKGKMFAVLDRKNKVQATNFVLQDILGKFLITVTTAILLLLYLIVVVVQW